MRTAFLLTVVASVTLQSALVGASPTTFSSRFQPAAAQSLQSLPVPDLEMSNAELGRYADELYACYDVDSNGSLDKNETIGLLRGTLYGKPCPTQMKPTPTPSNSKVDESILLSSVELNQFENFFGNRAFNLTRLYASAGKTCNALAWHRAVDGKFNTLTVAKTVQGKVIGGYFSQSWNSVPTYSTLFKFNDVKAFIFSLTENISFNNNPGYQAGSVRPGQAYTLVDWAYEVLHLRASEDSASVCRGYYNQNYSPAFKSTLTPSQFTGSSTAWFDIVQLETFQVSFF